MINQTSKEEELADNVREYKNPTKQVNNLKKLEKRGVQ